VPGKTIVFVNTKRAAEELEQEFYEMGFPASSVQP
jgi:superfamily II DNA/RNA helicase